MSTQQRPSAGKEDSGALQEVLLRDRELSEKPSDKPRLRWLALSRAVCLEATAGKMFGGVGGVASIMTKRGLGPLTPHPSPRMMAWAA